MLVWKCPLQGEEPWGLGRGPASQAWSLPVDMRLSHAEEADGSWLLASCLQNLPRKAAT